MSETAILIKAIEKLTIAVNDLKRTINQRRM